MYPILWATKIQRGLRKGVRCAVSGREFAMISPNKAQMQELIRQQREFSTSVYLEQDGAIARPDRSLEDRRTEYRGEHAPHNGFYIE